MANLKRTVGAVLALSLVAGGYTFGPMAYVTWSVYEAGSLDALTKQGRAPGPIPFALPFLLKHAGAASVIEVKTSRDGGKFEKRYLAVMNKTGAPTILSVTQTAGWDNPAATLLEKYQSLRDSGVVKLNWGLQATPVAKWQQPTFDNVLAFNQPAYVLVRQCDAKGQAYEAGSGPSRQNPGAIRGPLGGAQLVKGAPVLPKDIARVVDVDLQTATKASPGDKILGDFMGQYKANALQSACSTPELPQSLTFPPLALGMTRAEALAARGLPAVSSDFPNKVAYEWPGANGRQGRLHLSFEPDANRELRLHKISVIQKFDSVSALQAYAKDIISSLAIQHSPATELRWGEEGYWYKSWGSKKSFLSIRTTDPAQKVPAGDKAFFGPTTLFVDISSDAP